MKRQRLLLIISGLILLPALVIYGINRVDSDMPAPLWQPEALPLPVDAVNGWPLIAHYHSTTISGIDLAPIEKLLAVSRDADLGKLGPLFSPARVVAGKITSHTSLCREAFERERMVIGCLSTDAAACTLEGLAICSRLLRFAALDAAARGSPEGTRLIVAVLRQLADAADASRHPWLRAKALLLLRDAIHHAAVIIKWRRAGAGPVREALSGIDEQRLSREHAVIASYLLKQLALREALERTDTWLLDPGDTVRGLNEPFEAASRGGELSAPRDHTTGLFWWIDNPVGKRMITALKPGADDDFVEVETLRATVLARRDEALALK